MLQGLFVLGQAGAAPANSGAPAPSTPAPAGAPVAPAPGAQGVPPGAAPMGQSPMFPMGMIMLIFGIVIFMSFRSQRRRDKERQDLLKSVKSGDRVLFGGGIVGVISNVKERTYVVRVGDKVKMEILRGAVTSVIRSEDLPADTQADLGN